MKYYIYGRQILTIYKKHILFVKERNARLNKLYIVGIEMV